MLASALVVATGAAFLAACTAAAPTKKKHPYADPGDMFGDLDEVPVEQPLQPTEVNPDSGAFGAPSRPSAGSHDGGPSRADAGPSDAGTGEKVYCDAPLALGDLAVVELMISSRAGSGDDGEWLEVQSTRDCWLDVGGVTIESPRGAAAPNVATVPDGTELPPRGTFVVADSSDAAKNHDLPGVVVAWSAADVLKNDGDTVYVKSGATVLDQLTYPAFSNLEPGRSLAFPDDCTWAVRADWQRWSLTFDSWAPGMKGTPNATNGDVACY